MQKSKQSKAADYVIALAGATRAGSAYDILDHIRRQAGSKAIKELDTPKYARLLIEDAPYFVPQGALEFLESAEYDSTFDRALQYLAAMPSSGVRILAKKAATQAQQGNGTKYAVETK